MDLLLREERPADEQAVEAIVERAFGRPDEARLVAALRQAASPLISLVAEADDRVAGHILFTPVTVAGQPGAVSIMGLAPMAVDPPQQNREIGSALVRRGIETCRERRQAAIVVLGHPRYYPRFGFVPASVFGLRSEYDTADESFMALELRPGALDAVTGAVRYHPAFAAV